MTKTYVSTLPLPDLPLWDKTRAGRRPMTVELELTARCNLDCRHCYVNLPAGDEHAAGVELSASEIERLAGEAASMGVLWCLITGGEPLLRPDFPEIYLSLRKMGLLLSVFTNASLVTPGIARLFKAHPPRVIEVTVYGATEETYERVTRRKGSYAAFRRGLGRLLGSGARIRLKAMALRSNLHEMDKIAQFGRSLTVDYYRFDSLIHLRYDGDPKRNEEIRAERLSAEEIVALERADPQKLQALRDNCDRYIFTEVPIQSEPEAQLIRCGAGMDSFTVGPEGILRLCSSLNHPECVYDLRRGSLKEAWEAFVPAVRARRSSRKEFLEGCAVCPVVNLCLWCPAHSHLETGELDVPVPEFCRAARGRAAQVINLT
jgi:radical SAM protein with 4Fe4S-binding SPASM domain